MYIGGNLFSANSFVFYVTHCVPGLLFIVIYLQIYATRPYCAGASSCSGCALYFACLSSWRPTLRWSPVARSGALYRIVPSLIVGTCRRAVAVDIMSVIGVYSAAACFVSKIDSAHKTTCQRAPFVGNCGLGIVV